MAYRHPKNDLHRSKDGAIIGGVCSGLSETFKIDVTIIRVVFVVSLAIGGLGFWTYLILLLLLPKEEIYKKHEDNQNEEVIDVEVNETE